MVKRFKIMSVLLVVVLLIAAISACATKPAPAPTPAPAPAPAPAPTITPVELKFHTNFPPTTGPSVEGQLLGDIVSKASNGAIKITVYPSEQLGKNSATLDMLKNGIADMAAVSNPQFPTVFPLANLQELALGSATSDWATAFKVRNEVTLSGYLQGFEDLKFLSWSGQRPMNIWLKKKVTKAEDFNGLKLRTPNPVQLAPFTQFGVTTVAVPLGDVYLSLERGVIDGAVNPPENVMANKWHEIVKFGINYPIAYGGTSIVMSKSKWDSLPANTKQIFEKAIPEWQNQMVKYYQDYEKSAIETMTKAGMDFYKLDATEAARWAKLAAPVVDTEAAKIEDSTKLPAKAMVAKIREIAAKYK